MGWYCTFKHYCHNCNWHSFFQEKSLLLSLVHRQKLDHTDNTFSLLFPFLTHLSAAGTSVFYRWLAKAVAQLALLSLKGFCHMFSFGKTLAMGKMYKRKMIKYSASAALNEQLFVKHSAIYCLYISSVHKKIILLLIHIPKWDNTVLLKVMELQF